MPALAHKPSDSYLSLSVPAPDEPPTTRATLAGRWDIALRDLDFALGLDADGDGQITWGELRARHAEIAAYAQARLVVRVDGAACTLAVGAQQVDEHTDGAYSVLPLSLQCPGDGAAATPVPAQLELEYRLFADIDPQHRGLLSLSAQGATRTAVMGPQAPKQTFELGATSRWQQFVDYAREGVWHIWIGFDHILFLLSLLLPAVLVWQPAPDRREPAHWAAVPQFGPAFWDVLRIVTSFTLAHSITLSLATLGWIELPSRGVESAIAASVVLAALNNIRPLFTGRRWIVAFVFGLIHGFGFASVLADLGLPQGALVLALLGFNLGVEAGQLAIVALFLPLAFALRRTAFYRRLVMVGGSWLIVALASVWLAERLFNLKLLPF
ncbi:MAG: HupE/UreJ family protein [Chitinophagaceae bacterium]|nr:HupE/UreJ family protein [Rubrivivax sp.]